ncbi:aldo/keto reductase [Desulfopila inferna]|uniref:aldo/keto reductase n=1 Tax=Desulfopila inferna TaxID=468528 RepID=UPI001964EAFC|nr:aldo/keto reductase [Desulfopila inferna]MBM9606428.1 aldo/keto reductase [Desulfopila inferna]
MKMTLLSADFSSPALGLGCWGMSDAYGPADEKESMATIEAALAAGLRHFDTADVYGDGHNETLLSKALAGRRQDVFLATKFGFVGDEHGQVRVDGRPQRVKTACESSLRRLGTEVIDLYYLHRRDERVPIEETVGAMADLVRQGKVRYLGLSEVSAETLRRASTIHPIAAVQSEYSLFTRDPEKTVLPACRELGTALVAFSPLGRGLLSGKVKSRQELADGDYRRNMPRFADDNLEENLALVKALENMALEKNATAAQVALAWLLNQGPDILPIPGMKRLKHLQENLGALNIKLSTDDLSRLSTLSEAVQGQRHNPQNLKFIDS